MISTPQTWANDLRRIRPGSPTAYGFEIPRGSLAAAALRAISSVVDQTMIQASAYLLTGGFHAGRKGLGGHGTWMLSEDESYRFTSCGVIAVHPSDVNSTNAANLCELVSRVLCDWKVSLHEESLFECAASVSGCDLFELRRLVRCHASYLESVRSPRACRTGFFSPKKEHPAAEEHYRAYWLSDTGIRPECFSHPATGSLRSTGQADHGAETKVGVTPH